MKNNKIFLVLRIAQCLQNRINVNTTMFKKIPYVLQHCGIDLGLIYEMGVNSPYSKEFDEVFMDLLNSGLINIIKMKNVNLVKVSDKFDVSHYEFADYEKEACNKVYKLFLNFKTATEIEIFTVLMDGNLEKSNRYKNARYLDTIERMYKILLNFTQP